MINKIRHAIILAAGRGQRLMPLTNDIPKPMVEYNGTSLIENGIENIRKHINFIHVTVGYKGAMLAEHVIKLGASTVINTEGQTNSWWIYNSLLKHLNEPVFVLTCDNVIELDFDMLVEDYFTNNCPACMVVPVIPMDGLEGDYIFHKNNIVVEINREKKSDIYCSGIQIINPYKINKLIDTNLHKDFYSVWYQLILKKQMYCAKIYPKQWISVDTPEHLEVLKNNNLLKI